MPGNEPRESEPAAEQAGRSEKLALDYIQSALRGLRFGQVTVVVQDGVVVQVERTERTRPPRPNSRRP